MRTIACALLGVVLLVSCTPVPLEKPQEEPVQPKISQEEISNSEPDTTPTVSLEEAIELPIGDLLDTPGWETYRSEEYGFEFRYPKEVTIEEENRTKGQSFRIEWPHDESDESVHFPFMSMGIYDHSRGHYYKDTNGFGTAECSGGPGFGPQPKVQLGTAFGYLSEGSTAGGYEISLCIESDTVDVTFGGIEQNGNMTPIVSVLSTFKFFQ